MLADMKYIETDLAYAAGFLDADGCVTVSRCPMKTAVGFYSYRIGVLVSNKVPEVPTWLAEVFGGSVKLQLPSKSSLSRQKSFPPMYTWCLYNNKGADFLELIAPYLKIKKQRAEAAIRLARMQKRRGRTGPRLGVSKVIPIEELQQREELAMEIRRANMRTSARIHQFAEQEFA